VEIIPDQAEHHSGEGRKVFGFRPESCSPSARNRVRDHPGTLFGFTPESRSPSSGIRIDRPDFHRDPWIYRSAFKHLGHARRPVSQKYGRLRLGHREYGCRIRGMVFSLLTGWVVDHYSYVPVFIGFGILPLIAAAILWSLSDEMEATAGDGGDGS